MVSYVGKVSATARSIPMTTTGSRYTAVGTCYPCPVTLLETNLDAYFTAAPAFLRDRLHVYDAVTNRYKPYTWDGTNWREGTSGPVADAYELQPGTGYFIQLIGSPGFTWTYPKPYASPPN